MGVQKFSRAIFGGMKPTQASDSDVTFYKLINIMRWLKKYLTSWASPN